MDEQQVREMRESIGGKLLDDYIESNETLKSIIEFFQQNGSGLLALLGGGAAIGALGGVLGGGALGNITGGISATVGARLILGKERYGAVMDKLQGAAAPAFNLIETLMGRSGLLDIPIVGDTLGKVIEIGRDNPLAGLAAASGNIGAAAGVLGGDFLVRGYDGNITSADMIENLMNQIGLGSLQISPNLASDGKGFNPGPETASGDLIRGVQGSNSNGENSMSNLIQINPNTITQDLGSGGISGAAGVNA